MNDVPVAVGATEPLWNTTALTFLTTIPTWALVLVAIGLIGQLFLHLSSTRGAPIKLRATLVALRALLACAVFFVVLEPGKKSMQTTREPNRVVLALDASASMAEKEGGATRASVAASAAQRLIEDLRTRDGAFTPELYAFDGSWRRLPTEELAAWASGALTPAGAASKLSVPVASVVASHDPTGAPLGGVVLFSDGADSTGLTPALSAELARDLERTGAPVHAVAIGDPSRFKDVALVRAVADEFAFVRNKLTVDVVVRHKGYGGAVVPLTLREDGRPVATTEVTLADDDGAESKATFSFEPQRAGKRIYTITAPVFADESIADNNRIDFALKLIRDRIRVLQVAGRPSWDERFIRRLLKENPSVDLISFFILRSTTDSANASNRELSLIPFPTRELFTEELGTFDVVIFQDFNYAPYQMGIYLENVKRFVEESGGGFLMIGGELSFSEAGYEDTPIADVLPVRLLPGTGHLNTDAFVPTVTEAGRSHPITDLGDAGEGFAALPPLEGVNVAAGLVPGAEALLVHPHQNGDDGPLPVVAVREVGKGRSMSVMTDSTWQWSLPHVGGGGRGDAHRRFYANALRWLIRDPELSRTKLIVDVANAAQGVEPGQPVPLEVRTFNARYQPEGGDNVRLVLEPLDAVQGAAQDAVGAPVVLEGVSQDGAWRTSFVPPTAGVWRVRAEAARDGKNIGVDEDAFVVRATATERLYLEPRPDLLQAIAQKGGGRQVAPGDVTRLTFVDHEVERVLLQKTEPLWSTPWVLGGLVLLAGVEWWWRRRRGFA